MFTFHEMILGRAATLQLSDAEVSAWFDDRDNLTEAEQIERYLRPKRTDDHHANWGAQFLALVTWAHSVTGIPREELECAWRPDVFDPYLAYRFENV